ncbi:MAG: cell division protein ZapD [Methylophilaceae bacterium]|nr:cell division protein ZapD [Methylophilaceae bacterium]
MPSYEYPFNERIRTLLRLEDIFIKIQHNIATGHEFAHYSAIASLFQMLDVMDRGDLKSELLQELDRQKITMHGLRGNPSIAEDVLKGILDEIEATSHVLRNSVVRLGQTLRDNEWLMSIKQRAGIPGGLCEFDLPSYHYWLGLDAESRIADFNLWLKPLMPAYDAIRIILHMLRGSGATTQLIAGKGTFQQMLNGTKPAQMLRIALADDVSCFPEVSANKYAVNIRFISLQGGHKPHLCDENVHFSLTLCNL